jgi:hypothetical protein
MTDSLRGIDTDVVAGASGDDDLTADVLQVERTVAAQAECLRDLFSELRSTPRLIASLSLGFARSLCRAARFFGLPLRCAARLVGLPLGDEDDLVLDLRGLLVQGAMHLVKDVVEDVVEMMIDEVLDLPADQLDVLLDLRVDFAADVFAPLGLLRRSRRHGPEQDGDGAAHLSVNGSH